MLTEEQLNYRWYLYEQMVKDNRILVPCRPYNCNNPQSAKYPTIKGWNHENYALTLEELNAYACKNLYHNMALKTGLCSGIWVLDVDGDKGKALLKELLPDKSLQTVTVITGGGNLQLYFKPPKEYEGRRIKKHTLTLEGEHQELALLVDGQIAMLPGSIHPSGKQYRFAVGKEYGKAKVLELPVELVELFITKSRRLSFLNGGCYGE